jgi:hypothetical protein
LKIDAIWPAKLGWGPNRFIISWKELADTIPVQSWSDNVDVKILVCVWTIIKRGTNQVSKQDAAYQYH